MSGIHQFGAVRVYLGEKSGKYPDGNQVVVHGGELSVAFDTPMVARSLHDAFTDVSAVILGHVHEDHMAGLRQFSQVPVWVHEGDLEAARSWDGMARHFGYAPDVLSIWYERMVHEFDYQPRADARGYVDGHVWELGAGVRVRAHHLPGHTSGHCALVVESEGVAFIGDIDLTGFGPYYGDATSSLALFRRSLQRVRELDAQVWVTSHHRGVITERAVFESSLQAFVAKLDQRTDKLISLLSTEPQTLSALVAKRLVYPQGYDAAFVNDVERHMIAQHLQELVEAGRVRCVDASQELFQLA